jgi:hypothetical protein
MMGAMTAPGHGRTGVLIIRAWLEDAAGASLRARIIHSMDITAEEPVATSAATIEDVARKVQDWLEAFVRGQADL